MERRIDGRRRGWHDITTLCLHRRSNDIRSGMTSPPLGSTDGQRRRAWHAIIILGRPTRPNDVRLDTPSPPLAAHTIERRRAWHAIIAFEQHTRWNEVRHGMTSLPLDSTHGRTMSGVTCHHHFWNSHTVKQHSAWYAIIAFGLHTRSDDVGRGMTSSPLDCTDGQTTSGVA